MPCHPLGVADFREALAVYEEHGNERSSADALGLSRGAFSNRLRQARQWQAKEGLNLSEGARNSVQTAGLGFGEARGGHRRVYDDDGKQIDTVRWSVPQEQQTEDYLARIADAFSVIPASPPIIQSESSAKGKIAFFPHSDVHIGVDIDEDRGGKDYTPEIAVERLKDGFSQVHAAIPPCETAIILNNGDLTHANDDRDVTVKSQHRLKVRGSHRSNLNLAANATAWQIDMALQRSAAQM